MKEIQASAIQLAKAQTGPSEATYRLGDLLLILRNEQEVERWGTIRRPSSSPFVPFRGGRRVNFSRGQNVGQSCCILLPINTPAIDRPDSRGYCEASREKRGQYLDNEVRPHHAIHISKNVVYNEREWSE